MTVADPVRGAPASADVAPVGGRVQAVCQLVAAVTALAGAAGLTQALLFEVPGQLKYALTVLGPLVVLILLTLRRPVLALGPLAVATAHVAPLEITLAGVPIGPVAACACLAGLTLIVTGGPRLTGSRQVISLAALGVALVVVSTIGGSFGGRLEVFLTAVFVAWACALTVRGHDSGPIAVVAAVALATAGQAALAVVQYVSGTAYSPYSGVSARPDTYFFDFDGVFRPTSLMFDPISLGTVLAAGAPLMLWLFVRAAMTGRRWSATVVLGLLSLTLVATALTLSRMSAIGALVGLLVTVSCLPRRWRRLAAVAVLGLVGASFVAVRLVGGQAALDRAATIRNPLDPTRASTAGGDQDRISYWHAGLQAFGDHPLTGLGPGHVNDYLQVHAPNAGQYTHTHSLYIQVAAEAGLVGLAALVLVVGFLAADLRRAAAVDLPLAAAVTGSVSALAVAGLTDVVLLDYAQVAGCVAPVLGLAAGLASRARRPRTPVPPATGRVVTR